MRICILSLVFLLAGCAPAVTLRGLEQTERVPKGDYVGYVYSSGELEHLRVVFLKTETAKVDVEASSDDIRIQPMSFEQAADFVRRKEPAQTLDIQTVRYRGDVIGYLLTYAPPSVVKRSDEGLEVNFYERNGKIHFVIVKIFRARG